MLDEVTLRANLGCKIAPGYLVAGSFGDTNVNAIVAVSQTLDKLVVHTSSCSSLNQQPDNEATQEAPHPSTSQSTNRYVVIKDVIKSISVQYNLDSPRIVGREKNDSHTTGSLLFMNEDSPRALKDRSRFPSSRKNGKGLLLVGCSRSLLVYDIIRQTDLLDFGISTSVDTIANDACLNLDCSLTICGGQRRICALKLEPESNGFLQSCNAEIFCERALDYSVRCIIRGQLFHHNLLVCGSQEQGIILHQLDMFNLDIQAPKLSIKQNAAVNCLCAIITSIVGSTELEELQMEKLSDELKSLPPLMEDEDSSRNPKEQYSEQMNYFAYGLENGIIGVYYLFFTRDTPSVLQSESLWRQRCKQIPISMQMFDMNGDGYEELVIGYRNGRLDVRSPFTGQLLATSRCFRQSSDRLAGLTVLDYYGNGRLMLIACSTSGQINGYMPSYTKQPLPLRAYNPTRLDKLLIFPESTEELSKVVYGISSVQPTAWDETQNDAPDSFISSGLHIESGRSDNMNARRADAKQSFDYLLRINSLLNEKLELEKKACQLYRKHVENQFKLSNDEVLGQHRWDFDYASARLRLTIVVGAIDRGLRASFIRLVDEKRNFLSSGYLLIDMETPNDHMREKSGGIKSQVVVVLLRSTGNSREEFELQLSIFLKRSSSVGDSQIVQVVSKSIHVPQYTMLIFDPREKGSSWTPKLRLNCRLHNETGTQQILNWLHEKLLCLQFGCLIGTHSNWQATSGHTNTNLVSLDENGGFKINLVDALEIFNNNQNQHDSMSGIKPFGKSNYAGHALSIAFREVDGESDADEGAHLSLECESSSSHSSLSLLRWLVIDRLQLGIDSTTGPRAELVVEMEPVLRELSELGEQARQLEESEKRLQSELYELGQHIASLMQQLCISNQLNELACQFISTTSRELLSELFIMLNEAQNAARTQTLTSRSRTKLDRSRQELKEKVADFLSG